MSIMRLAITLLLASAAVAQSPKASIDQAWIEKELDGLVTLYRHFHQNPEVSYREVKTAKRLAAELREAGMQVTERVGGTGVVGIFENGTGPTVMLRADMDALPIGERTGLPYSSKIRVENDKGQVAGIMHACGHDIHMTNLIGSVRYLISHKNQWKGRLMVIGQPAEERGGGAKAMLEDKLFERFPKPDFALALHVTGSLPTGTVGYKSGYAMANVDSVDIHLYGKGGHGSTPHLTIDPIVQGAQLVLELQTIISREISAQEPAVITVGAFNAGTKHNIISDRCDLQLTVRSYSPVVRKKLHAAIIRKAKATAMAAGAAEPEIVFSEGTPSLFNDEKLTERVAATFVRVLGGEHVIPIDAAMTGEDFSRYGLAGVPICMFRLGTTSPERLRAFKAAGENPTSVHSPFYWPDARASLKTGIHATCAAVLDLASAN